jgi:hypothetical protein
MIGSVRCPNSAIAAPLAGAAEAPEAANSPSPAATIIARAVLHISFSRVIPQLAFRRSARMYLSSLAIKRVEDAHQKDMHALAGWGTRPRGKVDKWPTSPWIRLMCYMAV